MTDALIQASGFGLMLFGVIYAGYRLMRKPGEKFFF